MLRKGVHRHMGREGNIRDNKRKVLGKVSIIGSTE